MAERSRELERALLDEFVRQASHNLCLYYDNMSSMPQWLADSLSRFCTGDGLVKRTLFTDDDDFVLQARGVSALTCINLVITQSDLLDRCLMFPMHRPTDVIRGR